MSPEHQQHPRQAQQQQQQHSQNIQYINSDPGESMMAANQNQFHAQRHPNHNHSHHHHHLQHQQQHQQHCQQQMQTTCHVQQQQQQQSPNYSQVFTVAPPTPPSETSEPHGNLYLPMEASTRLQQQPSWVMQTQPASRVTSTGHQQHSNTSQGNCNSNYHQPTIATATTGGNHSHSNHQTPIASYYYDIDDGFSDIMSAPPTPEPQPSYSMPSDGCQQQQQQQPHGSSDQLTGQPIKQEDYQLHNYLPYNNNNNTATSGDIFHHNDHQQPQGATQNAYSMNEQSCMQHYSSSMSPDSMSTTSSSPSDHSLYQLSPPMSCSLQSNPTLGGLISPVSSAGQHFGQQAQQQQQHQSSKPIVLVAVDRQQQHQLQQSKPLNVQQQHHHHRSSPIHLWEFLKELLQQVEASGATPTTTTTTTGTTTTTTTNAPDASVIRWLDRQKGVFKIEDSVKVAKLWGKRKNKPKMNYDKLSRSIRQYYKKGIMKKTDRSQRLVYQFCSAYCH